jgi:hypothetical protein
MMFCLCPPWLKQATHIHPSDRCAHHQVSESPENSTRETAQGAGAGRSSVHHTQMLPNGKTAASPVTPPPQRPRERSRRGGAPSSTWRADTEEVKRRDEAARTVKRAHWRRGGSCRRASRPANGRGGGGTTEMRRDARRISLSLSLAFPPFLCLPARRSLTAVVGIRKAGEGR